MLFNVTVRVALQCDKMGMSQASVAMSCSVLQCLAVSCSIVQCLAVSCSVLQFVYYKLQDTARHYKTLQDTSVGLHVLDPQWVAKPSE